MPVSGFLPQKLGGHHRTAGRYRRKHIDQQVVDHIHQGYARRGRLPALDTIIVSTIPR